MKHIKYFIGLMFLFLVAGCEDKNDSQLYISSTVLTFDNGGGSQTISIECNTDWVASTMSNWVTVYPSSGSRSGKITITVPQKSNELEQETKVIIRTTDGEKVTNVSVKVTGASSLMGKHLEIKSANVYLGGKAGYVDSINIYSNLSWEVRGPEWLEAWDGNRWRPLMQNRGVVRGEGERKLFLRTSKDNKNDDSLEGILTIQEYLTCEHMVSLNVAQLGRLEVRPDWLVTLPNSHAFGWVCGCDVAKIYYKVTENLMEKVPNNYNEIRQTFEVTDDNYINSVCNLKSNTSHKWLCVGEDLHGNISGFSNHYSISTTSNAQEARIDAAYQIDDTTWRFYVLVNELTSQFVMYVTDNPKSAFQYTDPILYYIALRQFGQYTLLYNTIAIEDYGMYYHCDWGNLSRYSREVHGMVVAYSLSDNMGSMSRFDRCYDENGKLLPAKPLLERIPKSMVDDSSLR